MALGEADHHGIVADSIPESKPVHLMGQEAEGEAGSGQGQGVLRTHCLVTYFLLARSFFPKWPVLPKMPWEVRTGLSDSNLTFLVSLVLTLTVGSSLSSVATTFHPHREDAYLL